MFGILRVTHEIIHSLGIHEVVLYSKGMVGADLSFHLGDDVKLLLGLLFLQLGLLFNLLNDLGMDEVGFLYFGLHG